MVDPQMFESHGQGVEKSEVLRMLSRLSAIFSPNFLFFHNV